MFSMNKAIVVGNLGQDPEIRVTQSGTEVCSFSVATTDSWKDKASGEWKDKTEWHRITIWNAPLVERAKKHLKKGSKVYVEGAIETRKWTDDKGHDRYSTEIVLKQFRGELVLLDGKATSGDEKRPAQTAHNEAKANAYQPPSGAVLDDEIPF